jgi:molecular chaperone DnaK (HSP70)
VSSDEEGSVVLPCPHVETGYLYPEEVSAQVLGQLLEDATTAAAGGAGGGGGGRGSGGGGDVVISKAVITVPAYFNDEQREATVLAGKRRGS